MIHLQSVFIDILDERKRQDMIHGGPAHDDIHPPEEWLDLIEKQINCAQALIGVGPDDEFRARLIKIAALSVAAIEVLDRVHRVDNV
jgi:hypothetical protein